MWENTSSNSLLFMERPMYNEAANLAHRWAFIMILRGAFGKTISFESNSRCWGDEGAWRQEQENLILLKIMIITFQ